MTGVSDPALRGDGRGETGPTAALTCEIDDYHASTLVSITFQDELDSALDGRVLGNWRVVNLYDRYLQRRARGGCPARSRRRTSFHAHRPARRWVWRLRPRRAELRSISLDQALSISCGRPTDCALLLACNPGCERSAWDEKKRRTEEAAWLECSEFSGCSKGMSAPCGSRLHRYLPLSSGGGSPRF